MRKYLIPILIGYILMLPRLVETHDNKIIHPFTLTGKALNLIVRDPDKPGVILTDEEKKYLELRTYFHDAMPPIEGYWINGDSNKNGKPDDDEMDFNIIKQGTLGTISEDREEIAIGKYGNEVYLWSMFNHFYWLPEGSAIFEISDPGAYEVMTSLYQKGYEQLGSAWIKGNNDDKIKPRNIITYSILEGLKNIDKTTYDNIRGDEFKEIPYDDTTNLWNSSIKLYNNGDEENREHAYFQLGRILHLVQDMTCVPHVYDDIHLTKELPVIPNGYNNTYEDWEDKYYNIANYNASNGKDIKQPKYNYNNYIDYMLEMMDRTYKIARIQGKLIAKEKDEEKEGKDVQPPSELKKMFPGVRYVDRLEVTGGICIS